jgi:hypothetical protein
VKTSVYVNINEDGLINADVEEMYTDYKAVSIRSNLRDKTETDVIKELYDSEAAGLSVDSIIIQAKDSIESPLKIKSKIFSESYCMKNGDIIYYNPSIIHRMKDNPFKSERRNFPIDYGHPICYEFIENITIPADFEVKEGLTEKTFTVSPNIGLYTRKVLVNNNSVQIITRFEIKQTIVSNKFYDQLKSFYSKIVAAEGEQFVFARKK